MIKIAPSILAADPASLGRAVEQAESWGADFIHLDLMDGRFVPNLTFGPPTCKALRSHSSLPFDAHLMVEEPAGYVPAMKDAGADLFTFHLEADRHAYRTLQAIRQAGMRAGIALNPATPVCALRDALPYCDLVLIMSVEPGFGGQTFIPGSVRKIEELNALRAQTEAAFLIEVDGGINVETAAPCIRAGADVLVAGSSVFHAVDPAGAIAGLRG